MTRPILSIRAAPCELNRPIDPFNDRERKAWARQIKEALAVPKQTKEEAQENQRQRREWLYKNDPIWRLTKLKDNRERRLRKKLQLEQGGCSDGI